MEAVSPGLHRFYLRHPADSVRRPALPYLRFHTGPGRSPEACLLPEPYMIQVPAQPGTWPPALPLPVPAVPSVPLPGSPLSDSEFAQILPPAGRLPERFLLQLLFLPEPAFPQMPLPAESPLKQLRRLLLYLPRPVRPMPAPSPAPACSPLPPPFPEKSRLPDFRTADRSHLTYLPCGHNY